MATTNWVCEKQSVSEKELKALEKAKIQERKKIEKGGNITL